MSQLLFEPDQFVGYVSMVNPGDVRIHFPSSVLMQQFLHNGELYYGGTVGSYVIIEGGSTAYLARIYEASLPEKERLYLNEAAFRSSEGLHPVARADVQLVLDMYDTKKVRKGIDSFPEVGSKVYACAPSTLASLLSDQNLGESNEDTLLGIADIASSIGSTVYLSPDMLFGRHCAIVGTTGGGKSYTIARIIQEIVAKYLDCKVVIVDATGEFGFPDEYTMTADFLANTFVDYQGLSLADYVALFKPAGQSQLPTLDEAIKSLRMLQVTACKDELKTAGLLDRDDKAIHKENKSKLSYQKCIKEHSSDFSALDAPFDISVLPQQIYFESVYDASRDFSSRPPTTDSTKWGETDQRMLANNSSLMLRIRARLNNSNWSKIFGFAQYTDAHDKKTKSLEKTFEEFYSSDKKRIFRIRLDNIPSDENLHAVLVNNIGDFLYKKAKGSEAFKDKPVIVFVDESHRFFNITIKDEYAIETKLDAFERIAKECRKHGLFLCLSTQRPRDIPQGVLSQIGTFIVHRLINEFDKLAVENAAPEGSKRILSFVPNLGRGEAMIISVDLAAPIALKFKLTKSEWEPNSDTPTIKKRRPK